MLSYIFFNNITIKAHFDFHMCVYDIKEVNISSRVSLLIVLNKINYLIQLLANKGWQFFTKDSKIEIFNVLLDSFHYKK